MPFVNLTPHKIVLHTAIGNVIEIPPSGKVARIDSKAGDEQFKYHDVPVFGRTEFLEPIDLPAPIIADPASVGSEDPTIFIVSALFSGRVGDRKDVVYPGTGPKDGAVRNEAGQVVAVTRLIQA